MNDFEKMMSITWSILLAIILPFIGLLLIPLLAIPSELIEEILKGICVGALLWNIQSSSKFVYAFLSGAAFGVSETILYASVFSVTGSWSLFFERFITTVPLHGITAALILLPSLMIRSRFGIIIGITLAVVVHMFFNTTLVSQL